MPALDFSVLRVAIKEAERTKKRCDPSLSCCCSSQSSCACTHAGNRTRAGSLEGCSATATPRVFGHWRNGFSCRLYSVLKSEQCSEGSVPWFSTGRAFGSSFQTFHSSPSLSRDRSHRPIPSHCAVCLSQRIRTVWPSAVSLH